jgi:hypothetical protein
LYLETLALVTISSSFATGLLLGLQFLVEVIRTLRLRDLELKPNCLLTRYPIVFLTGRRSIFYFKNYWNQIPNFLFEHGYEVEILELPWKGDALRSAAAQIKLSRRERPCHLIADSSQLEELEAIVALNLPTVVSATVTTLAKVSSVKPDDLKPRASGVQTLVLPPLKQLSIKAIFLSIHNLMFGKSTAAAEVGANSPADTFLVERKYLEHAISLAEHDAR